MPLVGLRTNLALCLVALITITARAATPDATEADLNQRFTTTVRPFLNSFCVECHSGEKASAQFDLKAFSNLTTVVNDHEHWVLVREKLASKEMPPAKAKAKPGDDARQAIVDWIDAVQKHESTKNAGDPGNVLARRLSNVEYDYSIRDLTGVDIKPAHEFPTDPSNMAGFDNSGESLTMSPTLLNKYLQAAREVANHMYLREEGFAFAAHPMVVETDRDQFCVMQIIDFYYQHDTDYADYFQAAWRFEHRAALGKPAITLDDCARENHVSPKYLATIWSTLTNAEEVGPSVKLQTLWRALPKPQGKDQTDIARAGCEAMREYVINLRRKVELRFLNVNAGVPGTEWLPFLVLKNQQYASHRRMYDPAQLQVDGEPPAPATEPSRVEGGNGFGPGRTPLVENEAGDPDLVVPAGQRARYEAAFARFCSVFPDMFYMESRGRNYFNTNRDQGRYLSAGYHNVMGFFRDDQAFYELLLDEKEQAKLDQMWRELDFIANAVTRSYVQFAISGTRGARESFRDEEPSIPFVTRLTAAQIASTPLIKQLGADYLARVTNGDELAMNAVKDYFRSTDEGIRWVEKTRLAAEPSHLKALMDFAARAYRRPLTKEDRDDLLDFYHTARERDQMDHETALRETIAMVLISPEFTYRIDLVKPLGGTQPLSDYDLASRLSYFLWSSLPDQELLAHATSGDLHEPSVITAQARRMLQDPRSRALAVEFGGNWLDFRRFEGIATVDIERFPAFTSELRQAMYEEPIRFLLDVVQTNRPVLDLLYAHDTFVNPILAKHYGMPEITGNADQWVHIKDASPYERGGLLPMAVFLTKNAPGQRTSPVKRGNWVVRNILGERIPPPPPVVPELPKDEAKLDLPLREMLAKHREDPSCAACHARFDAMGLVFEGFGPVGDRREKDLAGRTVDIRAAFPDGSEGAGLEGLRRYIRDKRQDDFVKNLSEKLAVYALGRSLLASDEPMLQDMRRKLAADEYRFDDLIDSIVTSPQFLTKRGHEAVAER